MKSPRMNTRIQLQSRDLTAKGPTGQPVEAWLSQGKPWAEVKAISGRSFVAASGEQAEVTMQVMLRFREDVQPGWRVVHRRRSLEVVAVLPDDRSQFMQLMCKAPGLLLPAK